MQYFEENKWNSRVVPTQYVNICHFLTYVTLRCLFFPWTVGLMTDWGGLARKLLLHVICLDVMAVVYSYNRETKRNIQSRSQ